MDRQFAGPAATTVQQQPPALEPMHVKREPVEDSRERLEQTMDMSALQQHQHPYPHHQGIPPPSSAHAATYNSPGSYDRAAFDQRLANAVSRYPFPGGPVAVPQQPSEEMNRQEKLQKELNNYMLHHNIPSASMLSAQGMNLANPIASPELLDRAEMNMSPTGGMGNVLTMKRSNGKLAVPELIHTKDIEQSLSVHQRAKREFVPDEKKDEGYWTKRVKNNDSARRSRVKRKALEKIMEGRLMELQQENLELRHELNALKRRYGLPEDNSSSGRGSAASASASTPSSPPSSSSSPANSYCYLKASASNSRSSSPPDKMSLTNNNTNSSHKDDELEHQSSASDDSRSLDDSRSSYNVRSSSVLSQSLDPSHRDRADSFSSCASSNNNSHSGNSSNNINNRSPNSSSPPYTHNFVRTDKTGALDLTNDFGSSSSSGSTSRATNPNSTNPSTTTTTHPHHPVPSKDFHHHHHLQLQQQQHPYHHHQHHQHHHHQHHHSPSPTTTSSPHSSNPHTPEIGQYSEEKMDDSSMRGFPLKCRWKLSSSSSSSSSTGSGAKTAGGDVTNASSYPVA